MDKFDEAAQKGNDIFKTFLDQIGASGTPTVNKFNEVDYYFEYKGKKIVAELKVRYDYYSEYLIEEGKLEALIQKKKETNQGGALYVNFYKDSMYIFTLGAIQKYGRKTVLNCNRTTAVYSGKKDKLVRLVPTDKASRYDLKEGRWVKYED